MTHRAAAVRLATGWLGTGLLLAALAGPAGALVTPDVSTTTVAPTTTTSSSTTTTTVAPTTTTSSSTTTTTHPTTTTTSSSTTTTTHPTTTTSSSTPWGLVALVVVLALLVLLVALLYRARARRAASDVWRRRAVPALSDARLARESLLSASAVSEDPELRGAVAAQVERAATALEQAGRSAPDPVAGTSATTAAGALRGLAFAIEADRLLRQGERAPTGIQLAQADEARRARDAELQRALAGVAAHVAPARRGR